MESDAKPLSVGLYEQRGIESVSMVLLSPDAATELVRQLQLALATPTSRSDASWPQRVCSFPVAPQFKGREQYVSFHLLTVATPFTKFEVIRLHLVGIIRSALWLIGLITSIRWALIQVGLWVF